MTLYQTFIAMDASNTTALEHLQKEMSSSIGWDLDMVKPIEKDKFHFTILFLGDIHKDIIKNITEKLLRVEFESFKIFYNNIGAFPNKNFPRIVWVGIDDDGKKKMMNLSHTILSKLDREGLKMDQIFSEPHLTLFRLKKQLRIDFDNLSNLTRNRIFGADTMDRFQLKKSDLTSQGPIYSNMLTVYAK